MEPDKLKIIKESDERGDRLKVVDVTYKRLKFNETYADAVTQEVTCYATGEAAAGVIYDPQTRMVALVNQFRLGSAMDGVPMSLEIVAGGIDEGETAAEALVREAREEAGITLDESELIYINELYQNPGGSVNKILMYAAPCDLSGYTTDKVLETSPWEETELNIMSLQTALDYITSGDIISPYTIVALWWLERALPAPTAAA